MTWAKLDDSTTDDPRLLTLDRTVRLVYIEALVWSCRHLTDGQIPRHALRRITDEPDIEAAADALVKASKWDVTEDGWQIVDFLTDQLSAAEVTESRELAKQRTKRWRQHTQGKHDLCKPSNCRVAASQDGERTGARHASPPIPSLPSRQGQGRDSDSSTDDNDPEGSVVELRSRDERIADAQRTLADPTTFGPSRKAAQRQLAVLGIEAPA